MPATPSTMLDLGTTLPGFRLPDLQNIMVSPEDFTGAPAVLVAFICPHCPYVNHIRQEFSRFAADYRQRGLAIVAINSNDAIAFPEDGPAGMKGEAAEAGYSFPYLYDESQQVAQAFRAACTPDFFVFDADRRLAYRGQFDDSRPGTDVPVNGADLRAAVDAVLAGQAAADEQRPSIGCNIKWKPGNEPEYFKV
jgi:peroxiredoxin